MVRLLGSEMRRRTGLLLLTCAAGALSSGAGAISHAEAGDAVVFGVPWWFHGYLETGGRFLLNNPQKDGVSTFGGKSLALWAIDAGYHVVQITLFGAVLGAWK